MAGRYILTWNKDILADGYVVKYRVEDEFTELVRVENTDLTSIEVPNVKKGVENHFRIIFFQKKDDKYYIYKEENYYCFVASGKLVVYKFPTPKLEKIERIGNNTIIEWEKISDEVAYIVFRKIPGGEWERLGLTKQHNYTDRETNIDKKYIYTVRCGSDDGKIKLSGYSHTGISF